jgi:hypothetical protein
MCDVDGCEKHYGCQLRAKGLQVSPKATPGRVGNRKFVPRPMQTDSFRSGVTGETRRDGSFMPYIQKDGTLIRQGTMTNDRRRLESIRRDQLKRTHERT